MVRTRDARARPSPDACVIQKTKTNIRGRCKAWFPERKCVQCTCFSPPCNVVQTCFLSFAYVPSFLPSCLPVSLPLSTFQFVFPFSSYACSFVPSYLAIDPDPFLSFAFLSFPRVPIVFVSFPTLSCLFFLSWLFPSILLPSLKFRLSKTPCHPTLKKSLTALNNNRVSGNRESAARRASLSCARAFPLGFPDLELPKLQRAFVLASRYSRF